MVTNRKELLAVLRAADIGYKGADDLESVKKFLADEGHTLEDENGQPIDLDVIWAKTGGKKLKCNTSAVESDDQTAARLAGTTTKTVGAGSGTNKAARVDGKLAASSGSPVYRFGDAVSAAKKSYDMRAKAGQAAFPDADMAEGCCAYLRAAWATVNNKTYSQLDNDLEIVHKAAASGVNMTTGGALVPEDFRAQLIFLSENYGVARRIANVVPMTRDTATYARLGGEFSFSFSGENTAATGAVLPSDQVNLTAKKAIGLAQIPNELMDDAAISVADMYSRGFAKGIAKLEDQCYFLGDGTTTYGGIVGLASALPSAAFFDATGTAWTSHVEADINGCIALAENVESNNCAFVCSRQYYFTVLMPMSAASGRGTINEFLTVNGLGGKADAQWRGWPVYFSQVLPTATATSQKCLYFGDFRAGSMFGDRKELMIASSTDRYFDADQIAIRATQRFAISVHGDGRGSTYGPIVGIKTS